MARKYIDFTSNISVKLNGKTCSCPLVEIRSVGSDILQGCCYDEKAKCLTGQISDNPESTNGSNCITFWVACDEKDCRGGELVTRCFCDGNEDCGECETCGESGFCESRCAEGQFCDDDTCVDCLPGTCKNGKVCINGKCQCPKGSTEIDGVCRECDPDTFDVACKICIDGKVVDVDCPEGVCDPESGECVDCCVTGQCTGSNKACKDKKCVCAPSYTLDNCTNECVVKPANPCQDEGECGSCFSCTDYNPCTGFGTCTPTQCPSGFVCYEDDCIPKCDCDGVSTCGVTSYCKEVNAFDCGCVDCPSNSCTEGDGSCEGDSNRNCICNPATQKCEQDPCAGVICPAGSTCINGQCVKDDVPCNSDLSLEKIEDGTNCDLKGSVTLECCPCPIITVEVTPTVSGDTITFDAVYSKDGERLSNNLPTNNIAGNEEPSSGAISYIITVADRTEIVDDQGNVLSSRPIPGTNFGGAGQSTPFNREVDELQTAADTNGVPGATLSSTANSDGTFTNVVRDKIKIEVYQEITIAPNGCRYEKQLLETFRLNSIEEFNSVQPFTAEIVSTDCRKPLFIWSRDDKPNFRKIYKDGANGVYEDILRGPEAINPDNQQNLISDQGYLESCHTYTLEVDCDCAGPKTECIQFCDSIDKFEARSLNACNTQIEYTVPQVCDVNKNIVYKVTTSNNGIATYQGFQLLGGPVTGVLPQGLSTNSPSIDWVKLEMICPNGNCETCEKQIDFELDLEPPTVDVVCSGNSGDVTITVSGGKGVWDVLDENSINRYNTFTVPANNQPTLTVRYGDSANSICKQEALPYTMLSPTACCSLSATINAGQGAPCGGNQQINITPIGAVGTVTYTVGNLPMFTPNAGNPNDSQNFSIPVSGAGSVSYMLTDTVTGCTTSGSVDVNCSTVPNFDVIVSPNTTLCPNETTTLSASPEGGVPPYNYVWNTGATTPSISNVGPGNYAVTVTDSSNPINEYDSGVITVGSKTSGCNGSPSITLTCPVSVCEGNDVIITANPMNLPSGTPTYVFSGAGQGASNPSPSYSYDKTTGTDSVTVSVIIGGQVIVTSDPCTIAVKETGCDCNCQMGSFSGCPNEFDVDLGDPANWTVPTYNPGTCGDSLDAGTTAPGIVYQSAGIYTITYNASSSQTNCDDVQCSFNINVKPNNCDSPIVINSSSSTNEMCGNNGGSISINYENVSSVELNGDPSTLLGGLSAGIYTVELFPTDGNCPSEILTFEILDECGTGACCINDECFQGYTQPDCEQPTNNNPVGVFQGVGSTTCTNCTPSNNQECPCGSTGIGCIGYCTSTGMPFTEAICQTPSGPGEPCLCRCE